MSTELLELARTASSTAWPRYDATEPTLVLDDTVAAEPSVRGDACDFWDSIASP